MKIYIIRHAKVDMEWPNKCSSKEFDKACLKYDNSEIVHTEKMKEEIDCQQVYVSELYRSHKTARALFPEKDYGVIPVHEVPLTSFKDSERSYPLWLWNVRGRLQWFFNKKRQKETRKETMQRAQHVILELEEKDEDCAVVSHGFFMKTFIKCLKNRGYQIENENKTGFSNLQVVTAIHK